MNASEHTSQHDEHDDHGGIGKYIAVFVALCCLTSASVFTTSSLWPFPDQPAYGWAFMMAVSCAKALLVILFFMHMLWEANWKWVLTVPAAGMSVFLVLMLIPDVGMRTRHYSEERWAGAAYPSPLLDHDQAERDDAEHDETHEQDSAHDDAHGDQH